MRNHHLGNKLFFLWYPIQFQLTLSCFIGTLCILTFDLRVNAVPKFGNFLRLVVDHYSIHCRISSVGLYWGHRI